jgi:hypothetical protein
MLSKEQIDKMLKDACVAEKYVVPSDPIHGEFVADLCCHVRALASEVEILRGLLDEATRRDGAPLVYLACPYSHPEASVRAARFRAANIAAGALMRQGLNVFSPISHTHPIAVDCELPTGFDFWEQYDRAFLSCCSALYVLKIDGWEQSKGVQTEIRIAKELGLSILEAKCPAPSA